MTYTCEQLDRRRETAKSEPVELRLLKNKLANTNCDCSFARRFQQSYISLACQKEIQRCRCKDQEVQSTGIEVVSDHTSTDEEFLPTTRLSSYPANNIACNSCLLNLNHNLLQNILNTKTRVLKDEETVTKPLFLSDKSINNTVQSVEKTTSVTICAKPVLKYPISNTVSELDSIQSSVSNSPTRNNREVTFAFCNSYYDYERDDEYALQDEQAFSEDDNEGYRIDEEPEPDDKTVTVIHAPPSPPECTEKCLHCVDIDTYMNSIRPPMYPSFYRID